MLLDCRYGFADSAAGHIVRLRESAGISTDHFILVLCRCLNVCEVLITSIYIERVCLGTVAKFLCQACC